MECGLLDDGDDDVEHIGGHFIAFAKPTISLLIFCIWHYYYNAECENNVGKLASLSDLNIQLYIQKYILLPPHPH